MLDACTLPEDALEERLDWIRREIVPHAVAAERLEDGLALELGDAPGLADEVERLIDLEAECCPGLAFSAAPSATPGRLRLEVRGLGPDVVGRLASLGESAESDTRPRVGPRAAKAAGIGALVSLVLCCGVPIAAAALLGAAAAPLFALDRPLPMAVGAAVAGLVAWRWLGRRPARDRLPSRCGCAAPSA